MHRRLLALCLLSTFQLLQTEQLPIADAHLHWQWNQKEITNPSHQAFNRQ